MLAAEIDAAIRARLDLDVYAKRLKYEETQNAVLRRLRLVEVQNGSEES